jgi:hypothetical protein
MQLPVLNGRSDGAISLRRDPRQLRHIEIDGPELFQQANGSIGFRLANPQIAAAEIIPGFGYPLVQPLIAQTANGLGLSGGAAPRDKAKSMSLTQGNAQVEQRGFAGGHFGIRVLGHDCSESS